MDKLRLQIKLEFLAQQKTLREKTADEGESVYGYFGGNLDDAYDRGTDDGEIYLARELLKEFFSA